MITLKAGSCIVAGGLVQNTCGETDIMITKKNILVMRMRHYFTQAKQVEDNMVHFKIIHLLESSRYFVIIAPLAVLLLLASSATAKHIDPNAIHPPLSGMHKNHLRVRPAVIDTETTQISKSGHFVVTYSSLPDPAPLSRIHRAVLKVTDKNGKPVDNASIKLKGDMPEHGHGMATSPALKSGGKAGEYIVQGLKFQMPGWWELIFDIKTEKQSDSVVFNLDL